MEVFVQSYKQMFKTIALEYGFKSHKNSFYRVVNDVVQYFVLHKWVPFGRSCTIDFNIYPLCIRVDKSNLSSASYDIIRLLDKPCWWEYNPNNNDNVLEVLREMYIATKEHLIPFFEKATDCASAYEALCSLEKSIYTGIPGGIITNDYGKVCFAIKIGAYYKAIEHLKAIEKQNRTIDTQTLDALNQYEKEKYCKRKKEKLNEIIKEIELLDIPDMNYINSFVANNEAYSLSHLIK